jgi:hypothetical protein
MVQASEDFWITSTHDGRVEGPVKEKSPGDQAMTTYPCDDDIIPFTKMELSWPKHLLIGPTPTLGEGFNVSFGGNIQSMTGMEDGLAL